MIWAGALFLGYALASLAWAPEINVPALIGLLGSAGAFLLGLAVPRPYHVWGCFAAIAGVLGIGHIIYPVLNPNVTGAILAMALAGALAYDWFLFAAPCGLALVATESRTAIIAAAACFIGRWPKAALIAVPVALLLMWSQKSLGGSLWQRMGIWQDTMAHITFWGTGFGTFQTAYATWPVHTNVTGEIASHAYNDFLELTAELGIGVVPLWFLIAGAAEGEGSKLPLIAFLILGLTYFPFSIPVAAQAFAFALGGLYRTQARRLSWLVGA